MRRDFDAGRADAGIDIELGHAGLDVRIITEDAELLQLGLLKLLDLRLGLDHRAACESCPGRLGQV